MRLGLGRILFRVTRRRVERMEPPPLLVELLQRPPAAGTFQYSEGLFKYRVAREGKSNLYSVWAEIPASTTTALRAVVRECSEELDPADIEPLSFKTLVDVLVDGCASKIGMMQLEGDTSLLAELAAYEAMGMSRILALAKDPMISEFFADSDMTPIYLDHSRAGRCETRIFLTERERQAIQTHVDTFGGYTLDYRTPSLKNDLLISGAILRTSLDLEPLSANRFSMDVRRLNPSTFSMDQLVELGVITHEAAAYLAGWLESGGNVTIIGETGTGKTTLLNALDQMIEPKMRRVYIEDAVETADLLERGFHQVKLKVDPFERGGSTGRTKANEIVKVLHRSPDLVILSEIQSEEHSRAFFQALSAGARGLQTFHASTVENALRRWTNVHGIPEDSLLDLGVIVQMERPERLGPGRHVKRVCRIIDESGVARVVEVFARGEGGLLRRLDPDPAQAGLDRGPTAPLGADGSGRARSG